MSPAVGSSWSSCFWAASMISRGSLPSAASRALSDFCRPTPSGATWCGITTVPLSGSNASTSLIVASMRSATLHPPQQPCNAFGIHLVPARPLALPLTHQVMTKTKGDGVHPPRRNALRTRRAPRIVRSIIPPAATALGRLLLRELLQLGRREQQGIAAVQDRVIRHDAPLHVRPRGDLVHDVQHDLFDDRPQSPRSGVPP